MTTHVYFDLDGTLTDPYEGITGVDFADAIGLTVELQSLERLGDGIESRSSAMSLPTEAP